MYDDKTARGYYHLFQNISCITKFSNITPTRLYLFMTSKYDYSNNNENNTLLNQIMFQTADNFDVKAVKTVNSKMVMS